MKKASLAKKLLAILLSLLMVTGVATPAFAIMEGTDDEEFNILVSNKTKELKTLIGKEQSTLAEIKSSGSYPYGLAVDYLKKEMEPPQGLALVRSYFAVGMNVVRGISSVICMLNSTISLLKLVGVLKSETDPRFTSISESVKQIQTEVGDIDRKADAIQDTLTNEFAYIDLILLQQDYNHFKDEVWAQFYTDAVQPLNDLRNEYADGVNWQLISFAELWQDGDATTGLRSLFGKNEETGEIMQVFSGRNMNEPGEKLPGAPKASIDDIPVEYSVALPGEYICANLSRKVALNSGNCLDELTKALEKGVYDAAEDGKLVAYSGFDSQWRSFSEEKKQETAKELAANLLDSLAFTCAYIEANEKGFAASVKNAYRIFTTWAAGEESLTSPLYARFKMLSLTHGFEGEVTDEINDVFYYMSLMNLGFVEFVETVASMSRSLTENDRTDIRDMYLKAELGMNNDYYNFVTGQPNYCYQTESVIEYKNITVESEMQFVAGVADWGDYNTNEKGIYYYGQFKDEPWMVYETAYDYPTDKNVAKQRKTASGQDLLSRAVSSKEAAILYAMYGSSGSKGSFADYLAGSNVVAEAENVKDGIVTSMISRAIEPYTEAKMTCYLPTGVGNYYFTDGKEYTVKRAISDELVSNHKDNAYQVHDQASGGLLNTKTGGVNENAMIAGRTFYADHDLWPADIAVAFSTGKAKYEKQHLSAKQQEEEFGKVLDEYNNYNVYRITTTFSDEFGMLVSVPINSYTFPADTKKIPDNFFKNGADLDVLTISGTPEEIGENAFAGIGTPADRCRLKAAVATGLLVDAWHGGYFGNTYVTIEKNDGSGEKEDVVAVAGAPISNVVCTFTAPEHATFAGWSLYPNGVVADPDELVPIVHTDNAATLYAVWKFDHEHDFEVTAEGKAATCTEDGCTAEKTCKICGYKEVKDIPATGHTLTYTKSGGNYIAKCSVCDYEATLYPNVRGFHTVWTEEEDGSGCYNVGSLSDAETVIGEDGIYVITYSDPDDRIHSQTVSVHDGVNASICFDGMKVVGGNRAGFDAGKSDIRLTLKGENSITARDADAFVSAGNLTIDGDGSLVITSIRNDSTLSSHYSRCIPFNTTGAHTVINGGNICITGGDNFSVMINDDVTGGDLVIEKNACFYAEKGIDAAPVNGNGERVYPILIDNPDESLITVNSRRFPFKVLPGRTDACIYLTNGKHDIRLLDDTAHNLYVEDPENGVTKLEMQYGDFTVTNPRLDPNVVSFKNGVLTVQKSSPITIKNTDPSKETPNSIEINSHVNADITLAGVNINLRDAGGAAIHIAPCQGGSAQASKIKITLAKDTENIVHGGGAGISISDGYTSLTIDGEGTLYATGERDCAAIGSVQNKPAGNITINGGTIHATAGSYFSAFGSYAAAIGSGKIETGVSIDSGYATGNITINGGTVYANSYQGPAVGAGICEQNLPSKTITVNGGMLIANSNNGEYTIGGNKTEGVTINGGIVTATTGTAGKGGITSSKTVIENIASVKATRVNNPVNGEGKNVSLHVMDIEIGEQVAINGKGYRCIGHNGEKKMYLYLADPNEVQKILGITLENTERGKLHCSPLLPVPGDTVTLSAEANDGYAFVDYEITPAVEIKDGTFVMPDEAVTVKGIFARIGNITLAESEHGRVLPSKSIVTAGEKVNLYVMPEEGYELDTLTLTPETAVENDSFIMPEEDVTITCTFRVKTNTVTWNVDDKKTENNLSFGSKITAPEVEEKEGYTFKGWTPAVPDTMPDGDLEFFAVFEPITYKATFKADGKEIAAIDYTLNTTELDEPAVPQKEGYIGKWEAYTLKVGGITVKAQYVLDVYKARFVADGVVVEEVDYTVDTLEITEPAVPQKNGYTGKWSSYDLRPGGIIVNAVYTTEDVHQHSFETEYSHNEAAHWFACTCGHDIVSSLAPHTYGQGVIKGDVTEYTCTKCGYVKIEINTEDETGSELAESIKAAKEAIDKAALGGTEEVAQYAAAAKTELEAKTDIASVNEKLAAALEAINGMKTEKAVANALKYLDAVADGSSSNMAKSAAKQAKAAVEKAQTPEEVDAILADALAEIEAAEQALGNICPDCGKAHEDTLWGRIVCFLVRAYNWLINIFSKVFG